MNERIDIYLKGKRAHYYVDSTRNFKTLKAAAEHFTSFYGQPVCAKWSER